MTNGSTTEGEIETLAPHQAMAKVLKTKAGRALYAEHKAQQRAAA